jgi:hypothetical protein
MKFTTSSKSIINSINKDTMKAIGSVVDELYTKIVERNPMDTGFSSQNWNGSYNRPDYKVRGDRKAPPSIENKIYGLIPPANTKTIHLTNGVPYIEALEHGWSGQAPSGFVGLSVAEMEVKHGS